MNQINQMNHNVTGSVVTKVYYQVKPRKVRLGCLYPPYGAKESPI